MAVIRPAFLPFDEAQPLLNEVSHLAKQLSAVVLQLIIQLYAAGWRDGVRSSLQHYGQQPSIMCSTAPCCMAVHSTGSTSRHAQQQIRASSCMCVS